MANVKNYEPNSFGKLGREIKISPKSLVMHSNKGIDLRYTEPAVHMVIGIGDKHVAELLMSKDAWNALQEDGVTITLHKDFLKQYGI